jgi:hypothetical protein
MVETAMEVITGFDPEFQNKVRNNIILAGGGSQIRGLREYLEAALKEYGPCSVNSIADPLFGGADGALALAVDMPDEYWQNRPGRSGAFRPLSPLRTVRDSFPSHGSSIFKAALMGRPGCVTC